MPTLYFSRNPNPRLAVAVARYLDAPVDYEAASPLAPGQSARFLPLNPNLRVPILASAEGSLWEADAVACKLSLLAGSDFWLTGAREPEMIMWLSWGKGRFVRACDMVHFERGTKLRYGIGPVDDAKVEDGLALFDSSAELLDAHLRTRDWLVGDRPSYADFRMATFLPFNDVARLPLDTFPAVKAWHDRLNEFTAWRDPFEGLDVPELPPVRA